MKLGDKGERTIAPICPYCGRTAKLVTGNKIYPYRPDLYSKYFYKCNPCDAYVGTHKGKDHQPLGRLANKELRKWKCKAHNAFDSIWKSGKMKRHEAYLWLAGILEINVNNCHIGMFDVEQCKEVVHACNIYNKAFIKMNSL
jgi:hypothetical protein